MRTFAAQVEGLVDQFDTTDSGEVDGLTPYRASIADGLGPGAAWVDGILKGALEVDRRSFLGSIALGLLPSPRSADAQPAGGVVKIGMLRSAPRREETVSAHEPQHALAPEGQPPVGQTGPHFSIALAMDGARGQDRADRRHDFAIAVPRLGSSWRSSER
jgi:hypothetical protein